MNREQFDDLFNSLLPNNIVQRPDELWLVVQAMQEISAKRVVELGTANGGTLKVFEHTVEPDGFIVTVDAGRGSLDVLAVDFDPPLCEIHCVKGYTQHDETVEKVKSLVGDEPIDFLYIDADHSYESVKQDWENYHGLVRPGGVIGFHDVNYPPVKQLWNEIDIPCKSKQHHDHGLGTGIIKL